MKKFLCSIFIIIICLVCLVSCNKEKNNNRTNFINYHPEYLEQLEEVKDKIDNDFIKYLDNSSTYKSILYLNEYIIFGTYTLYDGNHFNTVDNMVSADYYLLYKDPNKTCWCGKNFVLNGGFRGYLYSLNNNEIDGILQDNNLSFNDSFFVYSEDENGYNSNFNCLEYKSTYGYANKSKKIIIKDYKKNNTNYYDGETFGCINLTLIKQS